MSTTILKITSVLKINRFIRIVSRIIADMGIVWPFVFIWSKVIKEIVNDDKINPEEKVTLLVINPTRFGNDPEILAKSKKIRILILPFDWLAKLLAIYWPSNLKSITNGDWGAYYNPSKYDNLDIISLQLSLRKFLSKFLKSLYKKLGIDAVISPGFHYKHNYDIGLVSKEIGTPYIVVQRERFCAGVPNKALFFNNLMRKCHKFKGSYILLQDEETREFLINSGYVSPDNIVTLGSLRMDDFGRRIKRISNSDNKSFHRKFRPKVTLFSFTSSSGLKSELRTKTFPTEPGVGYQKLFANVHASIAKLAMKNKDIDFVIKIKWRGIWLESIKRVCRDEGLDVRRISNLTITDNVNAHDLILNSDVICAFSSLTLLESAISKKPVIIPFFDEALRPEYQEAMSFFKYYYLFDCAGSRNEFENLIIERLTNPGPKLNAEYISKKYEAFEKHVGPLDGNILEKHEEWISRIIKNK
tara:strand:- start:397 stop:1812 length:1416 start_codon:yes stop_codon:yes gene_type:complete